MGIAVQIRANTSPLPKEGMTLQTPFFQEKHLTPRRAPLRIGPYARHQPDSEIGQLVPAERRPRFSTLCQLFLHGRHMIPEATGQLVETLFLLELGKRRTDFLRVSRRGMAFDAPLDFEEATSSLSIALQRLGRLREGNCRPAGPGKQSN